MTPRQREEQTRNFAAGNVALSNGRTAEEMRKIIDDLRGPLPPEAPPSEAGADSGGTASRD